VALADIINKIETDAEAESQRILAAAEERAETIKREATQVADGYRATFVENAEAEARREADRIVVSARLAARDEALAKRRLLVDEVLADVARSMASSSDSEYASFLASRVAAVARGGETLHLGTEDVARADAVVEALRLLAPGLSLAVSKTPAPFARGVLLQGDRVRVDLSLGAIVEERRDELELSVASKLFEKEA